MINSFTVHCSKEKLSLPRNRGGQKSAARTSVASRVEPRTGALQGRTRGFRTQGDSAIERGDV